MSGIPITRRRRVRRRARGLCEYCRSFEGYTGHDFTVDHIVPESKGGTHDLSNLCLCCFWCNDYKHARTHANDPRTGRPFRLFNPRADRWDDHFRWSPSSTRVEGRTGIGRSTVDCLRLNRLTLVRARQLWVKYGLHPPQG
jgi:hypothetical protein